MLNEIKCTLHASYLTLSMAYETRRLNAASLRALQELRRINQFLILIPISLRFILMFSSHPRLGIPKGTFPVGLSVKILKALQPSSILATCLAHLNLLDLFTILVVIIFS